MTTTTGLQLLDTTALDTPAVREHNARRPELMADYNRCKTASLMQAQNERWTKADLAQRIKDLTGTAVGTASKDQCLQLYSEAVARLSPTGEALRKLSEKLTADTIYARKLNRRVQEAVQLTDLMANGAGMDPLEALRLLARDGERAVLAAATARYAQGVISAYLGGNHDLRKISEPWVEQASRVAVGAGGEVLVNGVGGVWRDLKVYEAEGARLFLRDYAGSYAYTYEDEGIPLRLFI